MKRSRKPYPASASHTVLCNSIHEASLLFPKPFVFLAQTLGRGRGGASGTS
jgi:hypothetical protein